MIRVNLSLMLAKRKMKLNDLSKIVGVSVTNLSLLKTEKVKGIRFKISGIIGGWIAG